MAAYICDMVILAENKAIPDMGVDTEGMFDDKFNPTHAKKLQ